MPQFNNNEDTEQIVLPNTSGSSLTLKKTLTAGDLFQFNKEADKTRRVFLGISLIILDWNNTNKDGETLPITVDNVSNLNVEQVEFLSDKLSEVIDASRVGVTDTEKKTLNDSSLPVTPEPRLE